MTTLDLRTRQKTVAFVRRSTALAIYNARVDTCGMLWHIEDPRSTVCGPAGLFHTRGKPTSSFFGGVGAQCFTRRQRIPSDAPATPFPDIGRLLAFYTVDIAYLVARDRGVRRRWVTALDAVATSTPDSDARIIDRDARRLIQCCDFRRLESKRRNCRCVW